jgi:hypothetical protein
VLSQLYPAMLSHGYRSMSRKIQLMVLPDASRNRKEPRKCHSHTLAYLSILASSAYGCKLLKHSHIHNNMTPEVFLKFIELHENQWIWKGMQLLKMVQLLTFVS